MPSVDILVVDSGPFIKGAPLQDWSSNIVTIKDVIGEIKDHGTRSRLQVLPYQLTFKEPSHEAIKLVTDFSKRTGDYVSLSPVDLRLLALTYQLECENGPSKGKQLRTVPLTREESLNTFAPSLSTVGFYRGKETRSRTTSSSSCCQLESDVVSKLTISDENKEREEEIEEIQHVLNNQEDTINNEQYKEEEYKDEEERECMEKGKETREEGDGKDKLQEEGEDENSNVEEGEGEEEEWITPDNFQQVVDKMGGAMESSAAGITVGCMTTDYAMQNVLLQMGLHVLSVEGMLIKRLQTYAMQCKACFKTSFKRDLITCPSCGNRTMLKVLATASGDGHTKYSPLSHKQFSHKGLRYSVPLPKGGRQSNISQLVPGQRDTFRLPRSRNRPSPLDPDYTGQDSPFRFNDVTSKGAQIAFRSRGGRDLVGGSWHHNPNRVGKRKK